MIDCIDSTRVTGLDFVIATVNLMYSYTNQY